jgi:hypothetical protein
VDRLPTSLKHVYLGRDAQVSLFAPKYRHLLSLL